MAKISILILAALLFLSFACVQQPPAQTEQNSTNSSVEPQNQSIVENATNPSSIPDSSFVHLNTVPPQRVKNLARGVNVANWFWYPASGDDRHFDDYLSDTELEWIHARGFTFIRLPIDPKYLYVEGETGQPNAGLGQPNATNLVYINHAVERVLAHNLSIILELHENDWQRLEGDAAYDDGLVKMWGELASNWSRYDADKVFFEPVNEPRYYLHPQDWLVLQDRMLTAIRVNAPNNTLLAEGPYVSSIEGTMMMNPSADGNIIYTFHFYDPVAFTHQGASWLPGGFDQIRNLRYPFEEENEKEVLANVSEPLARAAVIQYAADKWNSSVMKERLGRIAAWAERENVTILAGEFGANDAVTPQDSRIAWLTDARQAFDEYHVGWSVWSYETGFGIGARLGADGNVTTDEASMTALGLGKGGCVNCTGSKYN